MQSSSHLERGLEQPHGALEEARVVALRQHLHHRGDGRRGGGVAVVLFVVWVVVFSGLGIFVFGSWCV